MLKKALDLAKQTARTALVAVLALSLVSQPFNSKASSSAAIISTQDSIAGLYTELELSGEPNSDLEVKFLNPKGETFTLSATTNSNGHALMPIESKLITSAGTYKAATRHLNSDESYSSVKQFHIHTGAPSDRKSKITLSKNSLTSGDEATLTVSLVDEYLNPLEGHVIKVSSDNPEVSSYSPSVTTNKEGEIEFTIESSSQINTHAVFTATDISSNTTLKAKPQINILSDPFLFLSSESGNLDHFEIEIIDNDNNITINEELTVLVSAVDDENQIITDYVGEIEFNSSDGNATLPSKYQFELEDAGSKEFTLSTKFVTPGLQTLLVNDVNQFTIEGELELEISHSEASEFDFESDFVESNFNREGDFTLISPSSGSYSNNTIDVQGNGQYGHIAIIHLNEQEAAQAEISFDNTFSQTITNLEDGEYTVYVEILNPNTNSIVEVSNSELVVIDTQAPEIVSISANPEEEVYTEATVDITVLSEANLENVSLLFDDEIYQMEESNIAGKYIRTLNTPSAEGEYGIDVLLTDPLGNDVQYRDQLTIKVVDDTQFSEETEVEEDTEQISEIKSLESPTDLEAIPGVESALISWNSNSNKASFIVKYGPSKTALHATAVTNENSIRITNLRANEVHYFSVIAIDKENNQSNPSEAIAVIPKIKKVEIIQDQRPESNQTAEIKNLPPTTPDTGAETGILLSISALAAATFTRRRA